MKISKEFIERIPKTDLHLHLDGSLRLPTLIDLARENGVKLPAYDEEGLRRLVFKSQYADLPDYLQGFAYTTAVLQTPAGRGFGLIPLPVDLSYLRRPAGPAR